MAHVISIVRVDPEDRNSALIELVCHEGAGHRVEYKVTWEKRYKTARLFILHRWGRRGRMPICPEHRLPSDINWWCPKQTP